MEIELTTQPPNDFKKKNLEGYVYVPSIDLYVTKERISTYQNWNEVQEMVHRKNHKMLNLPEFLEFLKYTKIHYPDIYSDIMQVDGHSKIEWLGVEVKRNEKLDWEMTYEVFSEDGQLIQLSEKLDDITLACSFWLQWSNQRDERGNELLEYNSGICLEDWIYNPTKQGLPKKTIGVGNLYYYAPRGGDEAHVVEFQKTGTHLTLEVCAGKHPFLSARSIHPAIKIK